MGCGASAKQPPAQAANGDATGTKQEEPAKVDPAPAKDEEEKKGYVYGFFDMKNPQAFKEEYSPMAEPTLDSYGGTFIMKHALAPPLAAKMGMKESKGFGTTGQMAFMLEFPTFEKAMGWFTGPEYAAVISKRDEVADFKMAVVEGAPIPAGSGLVVGFFDMKNPQAFKEEYSPMAEPTLDPYGGKFAIKHALAPPLAAKMGMKESKGFGETGQMAFVLQFADFEKAMGWFTGPEYGKVLSKRDEVADFKMAVVEAMGGSKAAAPAVAAPVEQDVVKCSMRGRRKPPNQKAVRRPQAKREVNFGNHDAGKWVFSNTEYDGSYGIIGGTPVVHEKTGPIQEGLDLLKQEPQKYLGLWYQTDMMGWPADQQQYSLCERRKQRIVVTESKGAPFTYVEGKYHALPDCQVQHDQFTDAMMYAGAPCTEGKQPGRGQGCADVPSLSVIKDVDPNDVLQGSVGDCWLLSAMSALAEFSGAVKKVFEKTPGIESMPGEGENKYVVTLYDLKTWKRVDIEVDERLPGNPNGAGLLGCGPSASGDLWAPYIEKACAIHCGGWDKINGGQCTHAWRMLTGCKEQYTFMPDANGMYGCFGAMNPNTGEWEELANSPHDGFRGLWPNPWPAVGGGGGLQHKITSDEMFERMCAFDDENYIMGAGTKSGSDTHDTDGIVDGHAYTVIDCVDNAGGTDFDLIKVRNPWGSGEFKSGMWDDDGPGWTQYPQVKEALKPVAADDGVFWVDKEEFFKYFKTIYVCAKDMTAFIEAKD